MSQQRVTQLEQPLGGHIFGQTSVKNITVMTDPRERATPLHAGAQVSWRVQERAYPLLSTARTADQV